MKYCKIIQIYIYLLFLIILSSCSTDFDITGEWKDITVVYGLLNQNDSIQYIKINKAFLGDDDALIMAQNPDSCNYYNSLEVKLEEWRNGMIVNTFFLDTTIIHNKKPGDFYYPDQILYKTNAVLNTLSSYKLVITNKNTGKIVSAQTKLIKPFTIVKPNPIQQINFASVNPIEVKWISAENAKLYQVIVRFHYIETNINTNVSTQKYVDWIIGSKVSATVNGGEELSIEYNGEGFFENLAHKLLPDPNIKRIEGKVEFIFAAAGEDFNTYMELSKPPSTIVQEKPQYTNITNGIGLFSCRYDNTKDNPILLNLTARSSDSLKNGRFTYNLGF